MSYSDVEEAIAGVLRASGVAGIDWGKAPYYVEAADPLPGAADSVYSDAPFPYVAYMLPESSTEHTFEDAYVETYKPTFYVVGTQKFRQTVLSPYAAGSVIAFLDSLRGTQANPTGPRTFNGTNFECLQFTRDGYQLGLDPSLGPKGQRVWVAQATYTMRFNLG